MKFTIRSMEIEPESAYLEFIGPAKASSACRPLRGKVRLNVLRTIKVRTLVLKFKGYTRLSLRQVCGTQFEAEASFLPKVKLDLVGTLQQRKLIPGEHVLSWELDIPNVYPRSLMVKRASIYYKLELTLTASIATGLTKKSLSSECPIVLLRHLLPNKAISPLVGTRIYRHTIPGKFHYEIDCPRIVCLEQKKMPIAIRFLCIASQKPVISIKTQILQVEIYRCENIPKSETNLENLEKGMLENSNNIFGQRFADAMKNNPRCIKFTRRKGSAFVHSVQERNSSDVLPWQRPVLLYHELDELLTFGVESPLVTIYHQLEVTFQVGHKFENIRAKIPVMITSLPFASDDDALFNTTTTSSGSDDDNIPRSSRSAELPKYKIEEAPHLLLAVVATANNSDTSDANTKRMDPDIARQQSVFMGLQASSSSAGNSRSALRMSSSMILDSSRPAQIPATTNPPSPSLSAFGRSISELNLNANVASASSALTVNSSTSTSTSSTRTASTASNSRDVAERFMNEPLPPRPGSLASSEALPMMDRRGGVHPATGPLRPPVQMNRIDPWLTSMLQREYTNDVEGDKDTASDDSLSISALSLSSRPSGSDDALHSRPPSPIAPGLPPAIPLQPQPQSSGLFEEEGYCGCASPMSIHSDSTRSLHSIHTLASSSIWPPSRPLVVDPYPSSVEAHYYHAALPPPPPIRSLPQTVSSPVSISSSQWYYGDSDDDADGTMPV